MHCPTRLAFACLLLALASSVHAGTYKWVDEDGSIVYSQTPPPDRDYERISGPSGANYSAPMQSTPHPESEPDSNSGEDVERIMAESQAIREKNCQAGKQNLKTYQAFRRIRDADGNVTRLTDEERAAKIEEAKQLIADFCD